jgi:hypothetical protein
LEKPHAKISNPWKPRRPISDKKCQAPVREEMFARANNDGNDGSEYEDEENEF